MMDPDNELYDAACELLAAAQRLSRATASADLERALPATLGCLESTLDALAVACSTLQAHTGALRHPDFEELVAALRRADHAADAVRASIAAVAGRAAARAG